MPETPQSLPPWVVSASRALWALPPWLRGKVRLARWLFRRHLGRNDVLIGGQDGIRFKLPELGSPMGLELLALGAYEPETLAFLRRRLRLGGTFIDVGANIGLFALPVARHVGPAGRVLAVEASARMFGLLEYNIRLNAAANITPRLCAAHDHDADGVPFWEAPPGKFGMGALAAQFDQTPNQIPALTLDRLVRENGIGRVDVIKADVEGFEAAVFRGACGLLTGPNPPAVVFEFLDWAEVRSGQPLGTSQRVLMECGYRIRPLNGFNPAAASLTEPVTRGFAMLVATRD